MKITFDLAAEQISIEGDEPDLVALLQVAREIAPKLASIAIKTSKSDKKAVADMPGEAMRNVQAKTDANGSSGSDKTLRQFARSLGLSNTAERIAAIAFYVKQFEEKPAFAPKEMATWFSQCGFEVPAQMNVAVHNAGKHQRFVENEGHGIWKITRAGENLVISKQNQAEAGGK